MRRVYHRPRPADQEKKFRINQLIRVPEVFLIDENGQSIGVVTMGEALRRAEEVGLDLVEVNPKANPPVTKILDMGQFRYKQEKAAQKQKVKQKKIEIKGIRLSVRISPHDFDLRIDQAKKFLEKGNKLRVELMLKGRERQHPEKAHEIINKFMEILKQSPELNIEVEQSLTKLGGRYNIVLTNKL